jgi:hypothetical protein
MIASSAARARTILRVTVPTPAEFSEMTPFFEWICFHKLKITARERFGRYATFSFRACRDPHARRGIWKKCCRVFWVLDGAWFIVIGPQLCRVCGKTGVCGLAAICWCGLS